MLMSIVYEPPVGGTKLYHGLLSPLHPDTTVAVIPMLSPYTRISSVNYQLRSVGASIERGPPFPGSWSRYTERHSNSSST